MKKGRTPFIFDIETGGKSAYQSSILSLSYFDPKEKKPHSEYAKPVTGSRLYNWPAKNVWKPIQKEVKKKGRAYITEKQIIENFMGKLDSLEAGSEIAGWNIGYLPTTDNKGQTGFDLPFLTTRAKKYGLDKRFKESIGRHKVVDLGQEFAVNVANLAVKHSDLVDKDLLQSAHGYMKYAANRGIDPTNPREAAEFLGATNRWMVGWKQESAYSLLLKGKEYAAHISEEDVKALRELYESGSIDSERDFVSAWNKVTLENKAKSTEKAAANIAEDYVRYQDTIPTAGLNKKIGSILDTVGAHLSNNKSFYKKAGLATGALGILYAIRPGSLFSAKDDEYNVIEGLNHKGIAWQMRQEMTDFGSGYKGPNKKKTYKSPYINRRTYYRKTNKGWGEVSGATVAKSTKDKANTIEGLSHKGLSGKFRKNNTEFGSGYRGPNPQLNPEYNRAKEEHKYKLMRASKLGSSYNELVKYFTKESYQDETLSAYASAGTALHMLEAAKKYKAGEVDAVEEFLYDPENQITGHVDLTYSGDIPADIKTVSEKRLAHVRKFGAFKKHISQLNWYMHEKGADHGYLEYVSRRDTSERENIRIEYSEELYQKDIEKVHRARATVEAGLKSGKYKASQLPKGASIETLLKAAEEEKGETARNAEKIDELERIFQEEMEYLETVKPKKSRKRVSYSSRFSAKDDNYNTIEGLRHGGLAEKKRKELTDFGSGYQGPVSLIHVTAADRSTIEKEGLKTNKYRQGSGGQGIYFTTKEWFLSSSQKQKEGLGIPEGSVFEYKADPTKVYAGYSSGGILGFFPKYKKEKLSTFLKRKEKPDIYEVVVSKDISSSELKYLGNNESDVNLFNIVKNVSSANLLYAGLTAKDISFKERTEQLYGKYAGITRKIPMALWLSESVVDIAKDPSKENFARFGLSLVGWEAGSRIGTKFSSKLIKGHKGAPGVIGHLGASILSSAFGSIIPAKDDNYNTIEGLRHGGLAEKKRKELTDFGSGYQGLDIGLLDLGLIGGSALTGFDRFGAKGGLIGAAAGIGWTGLQKFIDKGAEQDGALGKTANVGSFLMSGISASAMTSMFASSMMKGGTLAPVGSKLSKGFAKLVSNTTSSFLDTSAGKSYLAKEGVTKEVGKQELNSFLSRVEDDPRGFFAVIQEGATTLKNLGTFMRKDTSLASKGTGMLLGSLTNPYVQGFLGSPKLAEALKEQGVKSSLGRHFASEFADLNVNDKDIDFITSGGSFSKKRYMEVLRQKNFRGFVKQKRKEANKDIFDKLRQSHNKNGTPIYSSKPYNVIQTSVFLKSTGRHISLASPENKLDIFNSYEKQQEIISQVGKTTYENWVKNEEFHKIGAASVGVNYKKSLNWKDFNVEEYVTASTDTKKMYGKKAAQNLKKQGMRKAIADLEKDALKDKFKYTTEEMGAGFLDQSIGLKDIPTNIYIKKNLEDLYYGATGGIALSLGLMGVSAASNAAINSFSAKDDNYNTIEGLGHKGIAWQMRQEMTDFGSGWITKAISRGMKLFSSSVNKGYSKKQIRELAEQAKSTSSKQFFDLLNVKSSNSPILVQGGGAINIASLDAAEFLGLNKQTVKQGLVNAGLEANQAYISTNSVDLITSSVHQESKNFVSELKKTNLIVKQQGKTLKQFFDENTAYSAEVQRFKEGFKLAVKSKKISKTTRSNIEKTIAFHEATELKNVNTVSINGLLDPKKAEAEFRHILTLPQEEYFLRHLGDNEAYSFLESVRKITDNTFSGFGNAYNTIEGLRHGGLSSELRKVLTDFGSPVDLAKAAMRAKNIYSLFRGTGKNIVEHVPFFGKQQLSKNHQVLETVLERVRVAHYSNRPSRANVTYWTPSFEEASNYATRGVSYGETGYISATKKSAEDIFATKQSIYTDMFKTLSNPKSQGINTKQELQAKLLGQAKEYWTGVDLSKVSKNELSDIEVLISGNVQATKSWSTVKKLKMPDDVVKVKAEVRGRSYKRKLQMSQLQKQAGKQASIYSSTGGKGHLKQAGREYKL